MTPLVSVILQNSQKQIVSRVFSVLILTLGVSGKAGDLFTIDYKNLRMTRCAGLVLDRQMFLEDSSQDVTGEVTRDSFANCQQRKKWGKSQRENKLLRVLQGGPGGNAERCLGAGCKRASKTSSALSDCKRVKTCVEENLVQPSRGRNKIARKHATEPSEANLIRNAGVLPETRCSDINGQVCLKMISVQQCLAAGHQHQKPKACKVSKRKCIQLWRKGILPYFRILEFYGAWLKYLRKSRFRWQRGEKHTTSLTNISSARQSRVTSEASLLLISTICKMAVQLALWNQRLRSISSGQSIKDNTASLPKR